MTAPAASDREHFLSAVHDVKPIKRTPRAQQRPASPPPVPLRFLRAEDDRIADSALVPSPFERSMEYGDENSFVRPGVPRATLRKMRRGHWPVQGEIDLHGLTIEQAHLSLLKHLAADAGQGKRCLLVVHGKGLRSPNREPVLKGRVKAWLARNSGVLAFCEAPPSQGGSGALLVLLAAEKPAESRGEA